MDINKVVQEVVEEAVREGSTKDQLMASLVDALDLESLAVDAIHAERDRLQHEQVELRVDIEQLEDEEEAEDMEADWDLLEESIQEAEALLLTFD